MSAFLLRLKLLLCDKIAGVCYILCAVVISFVLLNLNLHAEESSRIPIGIVDKCQTSLSTRLVKDISSNASLNVYTDGDEDLELMLKDGYLNCILEIGEDYEKKVRNGDQNKLIKVYTPRDDTSSVIVQDIVAGYMMYDICFFKAWDDYMRLPDIGSEKLSLSQFSDYVLELKNNPFYAFDFDMEFIDVDNGDTKETDISNALIYRQVIAGINALLLMLLVFCACNKIAAEGETGIFKRRRLSSGSRILSFVLEIAATFVYMMPVMMLSAFTVFSDKGIGGTLYLLCLNMIFTFMATVVYYIVARLIKNAAAYQLAGTILSTVLGVCGFISVFSGLMGVELFNYTPVAAYITGFMRI